LAAERRSFRSLYDRSVSGDRASVLVRRATVEDAATVTELSGFLHRRHTEALPDIFTVFDPELTHPRFERMLAAGDTLIWLAELETHAVGYACANQVHRERNDAVHEEHALLPDPGAKIVQRVIEMKVAKSGSSGHPSHENSPSPRAVKRGWVGGDFDRDVPARRIRNYNSPGIESSPLGRKRGTSGIARRSLMADRGS
jgi:hypothetical protein